MRAPEFSHPSSEPIAIYMDRLRTYRGDTLAGQAVKEQSRQAVLDYIDSELATSYTSVVAHLEEGIDVPGLRDAERVVRYLAAHPSLDNGQRAHIAGLFNTSAHEYHLDQPRRALPGIDLVQPLIVELELPVDDLAEVS